MVWEEWQDYNAHDWDAQQANIYESAFSEESAGWGDYEAQMFFHTAFFDPTASMEERDAGLRMLKGYLQDEYDIEFVTAFDWEAWREWYDAT